MTKTVISIGHFKVKDVKEYLESGYAVIAYDPRKDVYRDYLKISNERFFPFDIAVMAGDTKTEVILKVIRDNRPSCVGTDRYLSSSTYYKEGADGPRWILTDEYLVKAVSIRSILEKFSEIEELYINCEGEEIPMIMDNPIDLFLRCKRVDVEFHCHVPHLNMTEQIVLDCIEKWRKNFIPTKKDYKPTYQFVRRG